MQSSPYVTSQSRALAQIVCSWSPHALSHLARQFAQSCTAPQVSFPDYVAYKAYFEPLLFAEIAAELLSAIDKYQRASVLRNPKLRSRREDPGTTLVKVLVTKVVTPTNSGYPGAWAVDLDPNDTRGPIGCVDSDVVVLWHVKEPCDNKSKSSQSSRQIPQSAVTAVVARPAGRNGLRILLTSFPDGNEDGRRTDLEDGEEDEQPDQQPAARIWCLLRLGSLTTMRREHSALVTIKNSPLLSTLLRPAAHMKIDDAHDNILPSSSHAGYETLPKSQPPAEQQEQTPVVDAASKASSALSSAAAASTTTPRTTPIRSEQVFTGVVALKMGLNPSQTRAIACASTSNDGFSVIQGPPGTGKTRTLIGLLNVIHMAQYQEYYEGLLASLEPIQRSGRRADVAESESGGAQIDRAPSDVLGTEGSLLQTMMTAMDKTVTTSLQGDGLKRQLASRLRRPRLLVCAPSNSAVDEILTRLIRSRFFDGQGQDYCPELARIGAGDRVSDAAKPFTAEGQAEVFLNRLCSPDMSPEDQQKAQMTFLGAWQSRCNALLVQLERTPKTQASRPKIIELHEKLERMDRDLRRLKIAAADGNRNLSRDEKLRRLARTYVEDAQLVFATLSGSASNILTKSGSGSDTSGSNGGTALFDTVVIDEGAQATETSCLIPLALGATRCLLVGDPQQLPATVLASGAAGIAYGQSLLDRVCKAGKRILLLDTQYRMHPAISSFPRRYFYDGRLVDDESVQGENRARPYHHDAIRPKLGPYVFLDIADGEERRSYGDRSVFNPAEAELAALIYSKLKQEYGNDGIFSPAGKAPGSASGFGVVTPYKRQMQELRQAFDRSGVPTGDVEIDTVDSYQGREKDFVVFSCVRTASGNFGIGFVRDVRRMNVGLTRARASLIVLGSAQALSDGSSDWAELVDDARSRGCLISVTNIARTLNVTRKLAIAPSAPTADTSLKEQKSVAAQETREEHLVHDVSASATGRAFAVDGSRLGHRVDPRTRLAGTQPSEDLHASAISIPDSNLASVSRASVAPASTDHVPTHVAAANGTTAAPKQGTAGGANVLLSVPVVGGAAEAQRRSAYLHSTLEQMSQVLFDAGFTNVKALEAALLEHVNKGGALDLETVMAAAIATSAVGTSKAPNSSGVEPLVGNAQTLVPVPAVALPALPLPGFSNSTGVSEEPPNVTTVGLVSKPLSNAGPDAQGANEVTPLVSDAGIATGKRKAVITDSRPPTHDSKAAKKRAAKEKKTGAPKAKQKVGEPSGWDMLFASGGTKGGAGSNSEAVQVSRNTVPNGKASVGQVSSVAAENSDIAQGYVTSGESGVLTLRKRVLEDSRLVSQEQAQRETSNETFAIKSHASNAPEASVLGVDRTAGTGGHGAVKQRPMASGSRVVSEGAIGGNVRDDEHTCDRNAYQHGMPAPGDIRHSTGHVSGFMNGTEAGQNETLGGHPGLPAQNTTEQAWQTVNGQYAMQQQAWQQQAMQRQAMQQHAMQQHVLQQQALQQQAMQQQAMQQHALQQHAMQQQALMMQMSGMGSSVAGMQGAVPMQGAMPMMQGAMPMVQIPYVGMDAGHAGASNQGSSIASGSRGSGRGRGRGKGRGRGRGRGGSRGSRGR